MFIYDISCAQYIFTYKEIRNWELHVYMCMYIPNLALLVNSCDVRTLEPIVNSYDVNGIRCGVKINSEPL